MCHYDDGIGQTLASFGCVFSTSSSASHHHFIRRQSEQESNQLKALINLMDLICVCMIWMGIRNAWSVVFCVDMMLNRQRNNGESSAPPVVSGRKTLELIAKIVSQNRSIEESMESLIASSSSIELTRLSCVLEQKKLRSEGSSHKSAIENTIVQHRQRLVVIRLRKVLRRWYLFDKHRVLQQSECTKENWNSAFAFSAPDNGFLTLQPWICRNANCVADSRRKKRN